MTTGKIATQDQKILQISCRKWSQIAAKIFFYGLHLISGKNDVNFWRRPFFLFLSFIQFGGNGKLVKAAKASPHAKFYNLSIGNN